MDKMDGGMIIGSIISLVIIAIWCTYFNMLKNDLQTIEDNKALIEEAERDIIIRSNAYYERLVAESMRNDDVK